MKNLLTWGAVIAAAMAGGCGDEAETKTTGALEIVGTWDGELPGEFHPSAALFGCPFNMPPEATLGGDIDGSTATIRGEDIEPGAWCVLAFLDANRGDGVMPINGLDWVAYPPEGGQSFPVEITAGETTKLEVVYSFVSEEPVDTETGSETEEPPGENDVWIHLTVTCETCTTDTPVVLYGYEGETMGTMPQIYNKYPNDVSFPFERTIKKTGALTPAALAPGHYIVAAYQDENKTGMTPDTGEPVSEATIIDLVAGQWNDLTLDLK